MPIVTNKKNGGFTLIETIIYVGLFGIMIVGLFVSLFQIMYNTHDLKNTVSTEEEMNFAIRKINWLLNDMTEINSLTASNLNFTKANTADFEISIDNGKIEVCEGGGTQCDVYITSRNITVDSLSFLPIPSTGPMIGVEVNIIIDGRLVGIKKLTRI